MHSIKSAIIVMALAIGVHSDGDAPKTIKASHFEQTNACDQAKQLCTFPRLVEMLVALGERADIKEFAYTGRAARLVGVLEGTIPRGGNVGRENTSDYYAHHADVILNRSESNKPMVVVLMTDNTIPGFASEEYVFRISLVGKLERAFIVRGKVDETGMGVRASGVPTILDINDPDVQYRFQHELDFWLKGMYRRKKLEEPAKNKENSSKPAQP